MAIISILANTVRQSVDPSLDDTEFGAGTFSWQDPVHSWKAGPGEVMTVENLLFKTGLKFPLVSYFEIEQHFLNFCSK